MKWFYYLRRMILNRRLIPFAMALVLCVSAGAQNHGLGLFNSPKGFGISYEWEGAKGTDHFYNLTLFADIYGMSTARAQDPGVKFNAAKLYGIRTIVTDEVKFLLYAGPGLTAGYAHDFEKGYWRSLYDTLVKSPGYILALSGTGGCRMSFKRSIMLDLSFTMDAGMHLRKEDGNNKLSMYKNGLIHAVSPQLTIYFLF